MAAGGVASLWNFAYFPSTISFDEPKEIVPGRVLRTAGRFQGKYLIHYNIHNHGLTAVQLRRLKQAIDEDLVHYNSNPIGVAIILSGDFNFVEEGFLSRHLKGGSDDVYVDKAKHIAERKRWLPILTQFTCVEVRADTHYNASANTVSCIDRTYIMAPSWMLAMLHVAGHVYDDPVRLYNVGISDHAPSGVAFSPFASKQRKGSESLTNCARQMNLADCMTSTVRLLSLTRLLPFLGGKPTNSSSSKSLQWSEIMTSQNQSWQTVMWSLRLLQLHGLCWPTTAEALSLLLPNQSLLPVVEEWLSQACVGRGANRVRCCCWKQCSC